MIFLELGRMIRWCGHSGLPLHLSCALQWLNEVKAKYSSPSSSSHMGSVWSTSTTEAERNLMPSLLRVVPGLYIAVLKPRPPFDQRSANVLRRSTRAGQVSSSCVGS